MYPRPSSAACCLPAWPGPRAPGRARRGIADIHCLHDDQQSVRFGHEGGDAGLRPDPCRLSRHHGRRRHGIDDQRAAPAAESAPGYRYGHVKVLDHMAFDGLENAYDGKSMGIFADATAAKYGFTREQQDAYATESVRARATCRGRRFVQSRDRPA